MIKKGIYIVIVGILMFSCKPKEKQQEEEKVVSKTIESKSSDEWITLFDGTSFDSWKGYLKDGMPSEWTIENGAMAFNPDKGGANIITKEKFTNFELSIEWKISEGGNSGIFYGVFEDEKFKEAYQTGPEIQILDNERHPDAKANPKYHQAGALYDMVQPSQDVCNLAGEWNAVLLKINHKTNQGSVTLNGSVIAEFPVNGSAWDNMVDNSKFKGWEGFGKYKTGHIGLQDHGDKVWYRNIKVKKLD